MAIGHKKWYQLTSSAGLSQIWLVGVHNTFRAIHKLPQRNPHVWWFLLEFAHDLLCQLKCSICSISNVKFTSLQLRNWAISVRALIACSVFFFCNNFNLFAAKRRFVFNFAYWVPHETDIFSLIKQKMYDVIFWYVNIMMMN